MSERRPRFGHFDPDEHEAEVRERWGDTDAYRQSARRTAGYGKPDWEQLERESDEIYAALAALLEAGVAPDSAAAGNLAERHRAHITRWFYDCTPAIHAGLGEMYMADPRFTAGLDRHAPGLARFLADAIAANAAR